MSVHHTRRRGPLPQDVEFACLDGASAGWSQVERDLAQQAQRGNNVKGKGKEGYVEIVPSVRMPVIEGLDGVSFLSVCTRSQWGHGSLASILAVVPHKRRPAAHWHSHSHFVLPQRHLTYGPLVPPQKAWVPLWLAVHLKKKRKCRVVAPQWMSVRESRVGALVDQYGEWGACDPGGIRGFRPRLPLEANALSASAPDKYFNAHSINTDASTLPKQPSWRTHSRPNASRPSSATCREITSKSRKSSSKRTNLPTSPSYDRAHS